MPEHDLKVWPVYFDAIVSGAKPWEVRINDRDFNRWDILHLREWSQMRQTYTGRSIKMVVSYLVPIPDGQQVGMTITPAGGIPVVLMDGEPVGG